MIDKKIKLSICCFLSGGFEIHIIYKEDGQEKNLIFSGDKKLTPEQLEVTYSIAAGCVYTEYVRQD